ncbi:MAG: hypothetical protein U0L77_02540, partial [Prevotellamassilia sp.]|nr:hypothetical protein [Prevotellamassilia sp.]
GEPTLEVRAEDKLVYTMPYEEEEDRGCEVKCPKGGGVCGYGSTPILLPFFSDRRGNHQLLTPSQKEIIRNTYPTEHLEFDRRNYQKEGVGNRSNVKRKDLDLHSYLFPKK